MIDWGRAQLNVGGAIPGQAVLGSIRKQASKQRPFTLSYFHVPTLLEFLAQLPLMMDYSVKSKQK